MNITEYVKERYPVWGWIGQRTHDAAGINAVLPLDFIISCDHGRDIPYYFPKEDVFSVEQQGSGRKDWSNEDLKDAISGDLGKRVFEYFKNHNTDINLLCYRSLQQLEPGYNRFYPRIKMYGVKEKLKTYFDNKNMFFDMLPELSLPRPNGMKTKPGKHSFEDLKKDLKIPFVVQFPYGSSGHFTFIIQKKEEYNKVRENYSDVVVVIREYVEGYSLNINAIILSTNVGTKVLCSSPSVQITGVPECSNYMSSFCGNDYSAVREVDSFVIEKVKEYTKKIGDRMSGAGYRGIFGMDFIVNEDTVYPIEINPRFQNSTSLYTMLNARLGHKERTLFLLHIAEFLQKRDERMCRYIEDFSEDDLLSPIEGAQIILHNKNKLNIITGEFLPGIYQQNKEKFDLVEKSAIFNAYNTEEDILVTCGVPEQYTTIHPNASICKVQMLKSVLSPDLTSLSTEAKNIVVEVYEKLGLKDEEEAKRGVII